MAFVLGRSAGLAGTLGSGPLPAVTARTVVLVSVDGGLRQRLSNLLRGLRWQVREASGGAEAMAIAEELRPEAMLLDSWLPDLEVGEFAEQIRLMYPGMEVLRMDGATTSSVGASGEGESSVARSPRRNELLHALRQVQELPMNDTATWSAAPESVPGRSGLSAVGRVATEWIGLPKHPTEAVRDGAAEATRLAMGQGVEMLPELVGDSEGMQELTRLVRLVAPRTATVLIEGETGTGKEVVARALHRLSARASRPFAVLNCAAIPETLLEAELFGHTRGAFTGAVQSRTGRIEAADGGTLFLDEIGEMPLALQAKMLRFLENGELQRVGDNETVRVDVRVIAATHQPLEQRSEEKTFRLDLYHRLAVFPIEVPPLRERMEDLGALAEFFLARLGQHAPRKRLTVGAVAKLQEYRWPGNVRELMHVLERGTILCGERQEIGAEEIRFRRVTGG